MKAAFKYNNVLSKTVHYERHKGTGLNPNMEKWVMKIDSILPVNVLREKPSKAQWSLCQGMQELMFMSHWQMDSPDGLHGAG